MLLVHDKHQSEIDFSILIHRIFVRANQGYEGMMRKLGKETRTQFWRGVDATSNRMGDLRSSIIRNGGGKCLDAMEMATDRVWNGTLRCARTLRKACESKEGKLCAQFGKTVGNSVLDGMKRSVGGVGNVCKWAYDGVKKWKYPSDCGMRATQTKSTPLRIEQSSKVESDDVSFATAEEETDSEESVSRVARASSLDDIHRYSAS